jgi:hypothetical protein
MTFKLSGNIYKAAFSIVKKAMSSLFRETSLTVKYRVFGEEIKVLGSDMEFYCYSSHFRLPPPNVPIQTITYRYFPYFSPPNGS